MQDVRGRYMSEGEFVDVRPFIKDYLKVIVLLTKITQKE
jgi:predicted acyl esterase